MTRSMPLLKRAFDLVLGTVALVILAVPLIIIAIAVKLTSPGPVLYWSDRVGVRNSIFRMPKFRSMRIDAPVVATHLLKNPDQWLTPIGSFLRKTSLDEFPQFLNVLAGQMNVVGPRPVTEEELAWFGDDVDELLSCHPGITGLWQTLERNDATWENGDRQLLELFYVRHASIPLDLRIFFRTFKAMGRGQ